MRSSSKFRSICIRTVLVIVGMVASASFGQGIPIPQDYGYSDRMQAIIDAGVAWGSNSTFHPLLIKPSSADSLRSHDTKTPLWLRRYITDYLDREQAAIDSSENGLGVHSRWTLSTIVPGGSNRTFNRTGVSPELWVHTYYHRNIYIYFQVRATTESASLDHYVGVSQKISRAGLSSAEVDQSLFGYRNNWIKVDFGRSREIWGAEPENNLLLAGSSPAYDRIALELRFKRFTYRWFDAYLETIPNPDSILTDPDVQRYMYGRCIEYNNGSNLILNIGETAVYAGLNRPLEISSLNPFSEHLEIKKNGRENATNNQSNQVIFTGMDWLVLPNLRFSGTLAADEWHIEASERKTTNDALLYYGRLAWSPIRTSHLLTLYGFGYRIDTQALQHRYGNENAVTHFQPIGESMGNDADNFAAGLKLTLPQPVMLDVAYGRQRAGDNSLLLHPYVGYTQDSIGYSRVPFPSGVVRTNYYLLAKLDTHFLDGLNVQAQGHFDLAHHGPDSAMEMWTVTLQYTMPYSFYSHDEWTR